MEVDKQQILNDYRKQEDRLILSQILDKMDIAEKTSKMEYTDFLDMYQVALVKTFLKKIQVQNYILYGGYEDSERNIAIFYPEKYTQEMIQKNYSKFIKIIKIELGKEEYGKYSHRNYLGGIVKLGMKREKVGDIIVSDEGADIIVKSETAEILAKELGTLTRFQNSKIEVKELTELRKQQITTIQRDIIVPSMRLDNIVSDLAKTSRSKAVQILNQERVFINGQNEIKPSKTVKVGDIITIRGKGRFVVKEQKGTTRSGRIVLMIETN